MDIKQQLIAEHSKENSQKIAKYVGRDLRRYRKLWKLVVEAEPPIPQRAAWVLDHCPMSYTPKINPLLPEMIAHLERPSHDGVKRNIVKILAQADIPEDHSSALFDRCIEWLISAKTAIAVKAHCMDIAANIAMPYPELREEVAVVINDQMAHGSKGIVSRGKQVLARMKREGE